MGSARAGGAALGGAPGAERGAAGGGSAAAPGSGVPRRAAPAPPAPPEPPRDPSSARGSPRPGRVGGPLHGTPLQGGAGRSPHPSPPLPPAARLPGAGLLRSGLRLEAPSVSPPPRAAGTPGSRCWAVGVVAARGWGLHAGTPPVAAGPQGAPRPGTAGGTEPCWAAHVRGGSRAASGRCVRTAKEPAWGLTAAPGGSKQCCYGVLSVNSSLNSLLLTCSPGRLLFASNDFFLLK